MSHAKPRQSEDARQAIMTAIREQLAASAAFDAVHEENRVRHEAVVPQEAISVEPSTTLLTRFRESLAGVGAHCVEAQTEAEATEKLRQIIGELRAQRVAISDSPLVRRMLKPLAAKVELITDATKADLFKSDLGITGAQWGIAETGTLVLESDSENHRLASLVPPVHIAILDRARIRHSLGEVLQGIDEQGKNLSRAITFITGPSRTSDIELTLAIGVHGPAELYVIVLEGAQV